MFTVPVVVFDHLLRNETTMLLELSFNYDTKTKVIAYSVPRENVLRVVAIGSSQEHITTTNRPGGGLVRAFYEYANAEVMTHTSDLQDFCAELRSAYRQVVCGGTVPAWLVTWFQDIDVYVEEFSHNEPRIRTGTGMRFYRDDGPRSSWLWKDSVKEVSVLLRPAPNYVER